MGSHTALPGSLREGYCAGVVLCETYQLGWTDVPPLFPTNRGTEQGKRIVTTPLVPTERGTAQGTQIVTTCETLT